MQLVFDAVGLLFKIQNYKVKKKMSNSFYRTKTVHLSHDSAGVNVVNVLFRLFFGVGLNAAIVPESRAPSPKTFSVI